MKHRKLFERLEAEKKAKCSKGQPWTLLECKAYDIDANCRQYDYAEHLQYNVEKINGWNAQAISENTVSSSHAYEIEKLSAGGWLENYSTAPQRANYRETIEVRCEK